MPSSTIFQPYFLEKISTAPNYHEASPGDWTHAGEVTGLEVLDNGDSEVSS